MDFNAQLDIITKEISLEYSRMFNSGIPSDHLSSPSNKNELRSVSPRSKALQLAMAAAAQHQQSPAQLREIREQRKEKFLQEFNNSQRYAQLKDRLKKAIIRIATEKYVKTVGISG